MVQSVADEQVSCAIKREPDWIPEGGRGAGAVGVACSTTPREGGDNAGWGDPADLVVAVIGDVQVAGRIERRVKWVSEGGRGAGSVRAA